MGNLCLVICCLLLTLPCSGRLKCAGYQTSGAPGLGVKDTLVRGNGSQPLGDLLEYDDDNYFMCMFHLFTTVTST